MMTDLSFFKEELLEMYKLKNIVRYNHRTRLKDETVAEHSFFTSLIALNVCERLNVQNSVKLDVLIKCLLHDTPEVELNDITYDVKCKLDLYPQLKTFEDAFFDKNYPIYECLKNSCPGDLVNAIVNYADAMSVLQYSYSELELGNTSFAPVLIETYERLHKLENILTEVFNDDND